jgi:hypothetical protein
LAQVVHFQADGWGHRYSPEDRERALGALEQGSVLYFPQLRFTVAEAESRLLTPAIAGASKNISLDHLGRIPLGSGAGETELELLRRMMQRFAASSGALLENLLPRYQPGLQQARTSFRPVEIAGRATSWRKDDSRLHIDAFPSSPVQGRRILRVFSNVNPHGQSRTWLLGEPFVSVARRYLPSLRRPFPGTSHLLRLLRITRSRRSDYDHFMLQIHDRMKADQDYQSKMARAVCDFRAGGSWLVFTDQVSHAATKGQHALEQTSYVPLACMQDPSQAPLRTLERLVGRPLT